MLNLQSVGDWGRSGTANPLRAGAAEDVVILTLVKEVEASGGVGVGAAIGKEAGVGAVDTSLAGEAASLLSGVDEEPRAPPLPLPEPLPPLTFPLPLPPFPPICGEPWNPLFIPPGGNTLMSPGIIPCIGNPGPTNCAGFPFMIPIEFAICAIKAIWFIIISCNIIGFAIPAIAFMSMPPTPAMPGNPFAIIIFWSELLTILSMRD